MKVSCRINNIDKWANSDDKQARKEASDMFDQKYDGECNGFGFVETINIYTMLLVCLDRV